LSWRFLAIIEHKSSIRIGSCPQGFLAMQLIKPIAALASVATIACSIFGFGWVGLALLGF
jgi:hypothetical protein